ncbi:MAG: TonB-dependent receptor [Candidatus Aminicenantes bacterium]|nr:TonB-dependent receptor [Candidatus Aminicenantes bacterium]
MAGRNRFAVSVLAFGLVFSIFLRAEEKKPGVPSPAPAGQKAEAEQAKKKEAEKDKQEKTKLFQLNPVVIDVVESARDKAVPNMTVVKPELFPQSIGVTLDAALSRQAGVDVQRIQEVGTAMDDDSIKIRGMGARRIKVLRNGRPLNTSGSAGGYFIDWTMIPLNGADRIEVVKGVGDPRTGNVIGGVVNLVPRTLTQRFATEVQASYASYVTSAFNLFHGAKPGAFEYSVAGGYTQSDGYLRNGAARMANADVHLGYDFAWKGRLTADLAFADVKKNFAVSNRASKLFGDPLYDTPLDPDYPAADGEIMYGGMGANAEPGSYWVKTKWTADLGYEQAIGEKGLLSARYWQNRGDRESLNTRASLNRIFHKTFFDDRSYGASTSYTHFLAAQTLTFGLDFSHLRDAGERNETDDFRAPYVYGSYVSTKNLEIYAMDEIRLFEAAVTVVPGLRYLDYQGLAGPQGKVEQIPDIAKSGLAPSLKIVWSYAPEAMLYFSAARALRMPAAPEYYWHYDPDDAGVNTSGLPFREEDGLLLQAGWKAEWGGARFEIAPYFYGISRYIQFDLINFVSYNIDRADLYGIELEVSRSLGGGWSAFANYTWQASRTKGDPFVGMFVDAVDRGFNELPGLPAHKANVGLQYRSPKGFSAALFVQAVSEQKVIYNNNVLYNTDLRLRTQPGYVRVDLETRIPITGFLEASVFVRNILDAAYLERFGFPAAGRNVGLSLKSKF